MATVRLYPTLSSFYKDQNIGFGSELDNHNIIICGVPEEKLYRKNFDKAHFGDNIKHNSHQLTNADDNDNAQRAETENVPREVRPLYPQLPTNDLGNSSTLDNEMHETTSHHSLRAIPSAPSIDILDDDIIRFLEDVIAEQNITSSSQDPGTPTRDYSTLNIPTNIVLDDSWIDDLQPDYDLTVEEIAADVLNNLNVEHTTDTKTHKEKSFVLGNNLAAAKERYIAEQKSKLKDQTPSKDHAKHHHKRHNHDVNGNNISASTTHQHQHQHERIHPKRHHRHHSPANRNSRSPTRKDARAHPENSKHPQVVGKSGHPHANKDRPTHTSNETHQHHAHPTHTKLHKETRNVSKDAQRHVSSRNEPDALGNRPDHQGNKGDRRHGAKRDAEREKENVASPMEMSLKPDGPVSPGSPEYKDWMKWRKQVNRQLATVILLRRGDQVHVQRHDMSRKPLNQKSIDFVSQIARSGNITSLGGKPYVMYGIPRATLSGSQGDLMY